MSSLPTTISIPTPSAEERAQLTHVGEFNYMDWKAHVYRRSGAELPDSVLDTHRATTIVFQLKDDWYIQTCRPAESTIETSLASLFSVHPWQIVLTDCTRKTSFDDDWDRDYIDTPTLYKSVWGEDCEDDSVIDFSLELHREFRCDIERADKMGYPRKVRKIRETLFKKDNETLHGSYEDYLHYYKQSLPDTPGRTTWARLRDYFRSKTLAAAAKEHIYILDPILFSQLARDDAEDAKQPPGGLEEDWYEYTINNS